MTININVYCFFPIINIQIFQFSCWSSNSNIVYKRVNFINFIFYFIKIIFNFLNIRNKEISEEFSNKLSSFSESIEISGLLKLGLKTKNSSFIRLCHEYLPLTFGRRHGDPSRPWNYFNIQVKDE